MDTDTSKHPGAPAHTAVSWHFVSETRKEATADVRLLMVDRSRGQSRGTSSPPAESPRAPLTEVQTDLQTGISSVSLEQKFASWG